MEPAPDTQNDMRDDDVQDDGNEEFELGPGDERLAEMIERAREAKRAVVVTRNGQPIAAIVDFDELVHLERLVDDLEAKALAFEYEAQDARGEVEYLTHEEMLAFQDKLLADAAKRAASRTAAASEVAGK